MRSILRLLGMLVQAPFRAFRFKKSMATVRSGSAQLAALQSTMEAYRRGDYTASLQAAVGLKDGGRDTAAYYFFCGANLLHLGRFEEAEKAVRESIARETDLRRLGLAYSTLGQLLIELRRFDEAMQSFETSLRCYPARGSTHRHMAEACLRRGGSSSQALEWATLAVREERTRETKTPRDRESRDMNLAENLATLAWAVALNSPDETEVDRLVAEAVPLAASGSASSSALVHHEAGLAYTALARPAKSAPHFEEAARVDPHGLWGRAAQAMRTGVGS